MISLSQLQCNGFQCFFITKVENNFIYGTSCSQMRKNIKPPDQWRCNYIFKVIPYSNCVRNPLFGWSLTTYFIFRMGRGHHIQTFENSVAARRPWFGPIYFMFLVPFGKLNLKRFRFLCWLFSEFSCSCTHFLQWF